MKKIIQVYRIMCFVFLMVLVPLTVFAEEQKDVTVGDTDINELYEIGVVPVEQTAKVGDVVEIKYYITNKVKYVIDHDIILCIDIPSKLELVSFKINDVETESGIAPLNSNFNRIYLNTKYIKPISVDYELRLTDAINPGEKMYVSHVTRDVATGEHISENWIKSYIVNVDGIEEENEGGSEELPQTGKINSPYLILGVICLSLGIVLMRQRTVV